MLLFVFQILQCQAPIVNDSSCQSLVAEGSGCPVPILPGSPSAQVKMDQCFLLLTVLWCLIVWGLWFQVSVKQNSQCSLVLKECFSIKRAPDFCSSKWWLLVIFFFLRDILPDGCLLHILKNVMGKTSTDDDHFVPYWARNPKA